MVSFNSVSDDSADAGSLALYECLLPPLKVRQPVALGVNLVTLGIAIALDQAGERLRVSTPRLRWPFGRLGFAGNRPGPPRARKSYTPLSRGVIYLQAAFALAALRVALALLNGLYDDDYKQGILSDPARQGAVSNPTLPGTGPENLIFLDEAGDFNHLYRPETGYVHIPAANALMEQWSRTADIR